MCGHPICEEIIFKTIYRYTSKNDVILIPIFLGNLFFSKYYTRHSLLDGTEINFFENDINETETEHSCPSCIGQTGGFLEAGCKRNK